MRTLTKLTATLAVVGAVAAVSAAPASAVDVWIGHRPHHHYYNYSGGGWATWNGCRPGWTVQGGVCKPYQGPVGPGWGWYR
jgi:hypothetical protein